MGPHRLAPAFHERVWGVNRLEPWFPNSEKRIGEVWFEFPPLLVKFLFTAQNLSVQVHPNDDYARTHHSCNGKTEMWHILAAEPGAKIAAGFREPVTREQLRSAAVSGEIEHLLQWWDAAPGDTFFIPAGTVHAIGAGLTLCEIQQHSDVTYRLFDYGRGRELHLDHGVEVSHLGPCQPRGSSERTLVVCEYFTVVRESLSEPRQSGSGLLAVIQGHGCLGPHSVTAGEVWHIPAESASLPRSGDGLTLRIPI
jgi:mannose-6-phosphate isomerase